MKVETPPGERIRRLRERAGLTQAQLAQLIGRSVSWISKVEAEEREIHRFTDVITLCRVLKVSPWELMGTPPRGLPDQPAEHPALPVVRHALLSPVGDEPVDPVTFSAAVEFAYTTWHTSTDSHDRLGVVLPELVRHARAAGPESADTCVRLWMLLRAWSKWVGAHEVSLLAAQRCADAATTPAAKAAAAWNTGMTLSTRGLAEESAHTAREAIAALTPDTDEQAAMAGALWLLLAVEASRLRDEHTTTNALEKAGEIAARTGEVNAYRTVFGPTNVAVYRTAVALELGRPAEAVRVGERVDVSGLPSMERRYAHLFAVARAYAHRRDDLAAVVMLRRAHREYPQGASSAPAFRAQVRALWRRETPTTRPELRPLAAAIGVLD